MVYISGKKETFENLKLKEGYLGSLESYKQEFYKHNPHITLSSNLIPDYIPFFPVSGGQYENSEIQAIISEVSRFSYEEREKLWYLQESHHDAPTLLALQDIMKEGQESAEEFRRWFDNPLISTPWISSGPALNKSSLIDFFGESSSFGSDLVRHSNRFRTIDKLYELMFRRDALNNEIAILCAEKNKIIYRQRLIRLENEIKKLTGEIKQLLPKKLESKMQKYLGRHFTADEIRKMRMNSYSAKMANKGGRFASLNLDVLNRSGLKQLKNIISGMRKIGEYAGKISFILNAGFVAYDTHEAYINGGNVGRTLFAGTAGVGAATVLSSVVSTSSLGALTIGAVAGDAAIGGALLVCSPIIGTFVAIVVGVVAISIVTYGVQKFAGQLYDYVEDLWNSKRSQQWRKSVEEHIHNAVHSFYELYKLTFGSRSKGLLEFYGTGNQ